MSIPTEKEFSNAINEFINTQKGIEKFYEMECKERELAVKEYIDMNNISCAELYSLMHNFFKNHLNGKRG